jgi:hypothetical protein
MLKIAIINPNMITFKTINVENDNILQNIVEKYVEIKSIKNSSEHELLSDIVTCLECCPSDECCSYKCYETETECIYSMYVTRKEIPSEKENIMGRFFSERHEPIFGKCILLNTSNNKNTDMSLDIVVKLLKSRFVHCALVVSPDDNIVCTSFSENPIDNTPLKFDNCRCIQIEIFDKMLCVFVENVPERKQLNRKATILCKNRKICGDVVVALLNCSPSVEVIDIDKNTFEKILCVRSNTSTTFIPTEQVNFYQSLNKYVEKYHNITIDTIPDDVMYGQTLNTTL